MKLFNAVIVSIALLAAITQIAFAQSLNDPLAKLSAVSDDVDREKVDGIIADPDKSVVITIQAHSGKTGYNDFSEKIGVRIKQVTIANPDTGQSFTVPITSQPVPLSLLKTGLALVLTPPNISPPRSGAGVIQGKLADAFPDWFRQKTQKGEPVTVTIDQQVDSTGDEVVNPTTKQVDLDFMLKGYSGTYPINPATGKEFKDGQDFKDALARIRDRITGKLNAQLSPTTLPIKNQAMGNLPPGGGTSPAPVALPTAAPQCTPADQAAGKCTSAGGIPCDAGRGPAFRTAIGCIHTSPIEFVKDFLKFAIAISGGFAFLMMLLGAFQMVTSAGNPDSLNAGREKITNAVIGLLFVIFAILLMQIIGVGILNIPGFE